MPSCTLAGSIGPSQLKGLSPNLCKEATSCISLGLLRELSQGEPPMSSLVVVKCCVHAAPTVRYRRDGIIVATRRQGRVPVLVVVAPGFFVCQRCPFIPFCPRVKGGVEHGGIFGLRGVPFLPQQQEGCLPGALRVLPTRLLSTFVGDRGLRRQVGRHRLAQQLLCLADLVRGCVALVIGCGTPGGPW